MSVYNTTYRHLLITGCPYVTVTELVEQSYLRVLIRVLGKALLIVKMLQVTRSCHMNCSPRIRKDASTIYNTADGLLRLHPECHYIVGHREIGIVL